MITVDPRHVPGAEVPPLSHWLGIGAIGLALQPLAWYWSHWIGIGAIGPAD